MGNEKKPFRKHQVTRTCVRVFSNYQSYKAYLASDFSCRCGYCDMPDYLTDVPFEIDHFIPRSIFSGKNDELLTKYSNLVYCCPRCNKSKSDQFDGNDLSDNPRFYDPGSVDVNKHFFRDKAGRICSDDTKGRLEIVYLSLYDPYYSLMFVLDNINELLSEAKAQLFVEVDQKRITFLTETIRRLSALFLNYKSVLRAMNKGRKASSFVLRLQ